MISVAMAMNFDTKQAIAPLV